MKRTRPITAALGLGGLSLAALVGGCADQSQPDPGSDGTSTDAAPSEAAPSEAASGMYTDGDYSATGEYQSPGGTESIEVELSLADGVVSDVSVSGNASGGNAERYQSQFEDGIAAEVAGVAIDDLSVDRVAGSSLTSDGFTAAVEQIKADALA